MKLAIFIAAVVVFDVVLTTVLVWSLVRGGWQPLMRKFPAAAADAGAVSKNFQSFRFGVLNFGHAIHVAVDETHLHLRPAKVLRWCGATTVSIPWEAIAITDRSRSGKRIDVKIGATTVRGPAWCLKLAGEDPGSAAND